MLAYIGLLFFLTYVVNIAPKLANLLSYSTITIINYLLNYSWTFKSGKGVLTTSWRYLSVVLVGVVLNYIFVALYVDVTSGRAEVAATIFSCLWPLVSFVSLKFWVFKVSNNVS